MDWLLLNPFLLWLAIGGVLLAVEVATGSGWLLWPTACAAVLALLGLTVHLDMMLQLILFSLLTIVTTLAGRRFFPRAIPGGDINDTSARLAGLDGVVVEAFQAGSGRVLVDGKEWAAQAEEGASLLSGMRIVVVGVSGALLTVKPG
ncbi:MAG TPA: NfeD family protein [Rhizomicrobium sp.]|nr:NfeD family protein [Rhizomicrobium sp.]